MSAEILFGEMGECWDGEVWEELGGLFEEGVHGVVEAAQVAVGRGHIQVVSLSW